MGVRFSINRAFLFNFVFYSAVSIVVGVGLKDYDNLLLRSNFSLYENLIRFFQIPSVLLVLFNILIISFFVSLVYKYDKLLYLLLIFNPFIYLNAFDAYNRFAAVIFFLYLFYTVVGRNSKYLIFCIMVMVCIHPYYIFSLFYSAKRYKSFVFTLFAFTPLFIISMMYFSDEVILMFSQNEKYKLLSEFGTNISALSSGNMVFNVDYLSMDIPSILIRTWGAFFPYGLLYNNSISLLLLSFYNIIFFCYVLLKLDNAKRLVFISTLIMIITISANIAVFNRHFLPLLIFLVTVRFLEKSFFSQRDPLITLPKHSHEPGSH